MWFVPVDGKLTTLVKTTVVVELETFGQERSVGLDDLRELTVVEAFHVGTQVGETGLRQCTKAGTASTLIAAAATSWIRHHVGHRREILLDLEDRIRMAEEPTGTDGSLFPHR